MKGSEGKDGERGGKGKRRGWEKLVIFIRLNSDIVKGKEKGRGERGNGEGNGVRG